MSSRHLPEDHLIEMCLGGAVSAGDEQHLAGCGACTERRTTVAHMLDDIQTAATVAADTAFPPDRLARQQARILQRIEHEVRPGRVLAFPAAPSLDVPVLPRRRSASWAVTIAAAAAGLVVGAFAGQLAPDLSSPRSPEPVVRAAASASVPVSGALRTVAAISDDEFLGQIELAVGRPGPAVLRPLEALTPRAWEVR